MPQKQAMIDLTQLPRAAQARIQVIEAEVDQLLHEVRSCENRIRGLQYLDRAALFELDASGSNFQREADCEEAHATRGVFLEEAVRRLFDGWAKEYWTVLTPDADAFIQLSPAIVEHVGRRCGRERRWFRKQKHDCWSGRNRRIRTSPRVSLPATRERPVSQIQKSGEPLCLNRIKLEEITRALRLFRDVRSI